MITITRLLARQVRAVFNRTLDTTFRRAITPVAFDTGPNGLTIRAQRNDITVQYHEPGGLPPERLVLPLDALKECEGTKPDAVTLEQACENEVAVRWTDKRIPRASQHEAELPETEFPALPANMLASTNRLLPALADASQTTDPESSRYALKCVQLQGETGLIVATDSRQALIQRGFEFPWQDDVLVPANGVFSQRLFSDQQEVAIGKTEDHVVIQSGPWTVWLPIEKEGRFPKVEDVIPRATDAVASLHLDESDAGFLVDALTRLPGADEFNSPATVDLNGSVAVRARDDELRQTTELVLTGSQRVGEQIRIHCNRRLLSRAVQMGFRELHFVKDNVPIACEDEHRRYCWMPLDVENAIKPSQDAVRIESPVNRQTARHAPATATTPTTPPINQERIPTTVTRKNNTDRTSTDGTNADENGQQQTAKPAQNATALIEDAEALKTALRDALSKTNALIVGLKRQRKQTRLMRSTLQSLQQLETIDA